MEGLCKVLLIAVALATGAEGHGRLLEPPSRSSMWRTKYTDPMLEPYAPIIEANYNDNQLFCGGKATQIANGYKCGVCGDDWAAAVKDNEAGGKYAKGIITRRYSIGQEIDVTVELTAAHKGFFEFRLCPWNDPLTPITHDCLNQHVLQLADGQTRYYLPPDQATGFHKIRVRLPAGVDCSQCVLQWRYHTGNSWGSDDEGTGMGNGPQEEFYGCSDVAISGDEAVPPSSSTVTTTSTSTPPLPSMGVKTTTASTKTTTEVVGHTGGVVEPPAIDCGSTPLGKFFFYDCDHIFQCAYAFLPPYVFACPAGTVANLDGKCDLPYEVSPPCGTRE